jgi:pimeloyl-ACP methyl ester carboxylesterase
VPSIVNRASRGDFREFGETALRYARGIRTLYFGMYLSVSCTEDFPRLDLEAARAQAKGTLLGAYRAEQQAAACAIWPRGQPDPERTQPVKSAIPTLLVSGEFDPVTPPQYAEEVAKSLSNARHVVVPKGSHGNDAAGCVDKIVTEAVKLGSVKALDVSCVQRLPGPGFLVGNTEPGNSAAQ